MHAPKSIGHYHVICSFIFCANRIGSVESGISYRLLFRFGFLHLGFAWREIELVNGVGGTNRGTFATQFALIVVDVGQIVLDGNGIKLTFLLALAAANAGHLAGLPGYRSFVLIHTAHKNASTLRTNIPELYNVFGTSLYAGAAGHTVFFNNYRQTGFLVHVHGVELAGRHTVATTQTAIRAACLATIKRGSYSTGHGPLVVVEAGTVFTAAVATQYSYLWFGIAGFLTYNACYRSHGICSANGAVNRGNIICFTQGPCQSPATH